MRSEWFQGSDLHVGTFTYLGILSSGKIPRRPPREETQTWREQERGQRRKHRKALKSALLPTISRPEEFISQDSEPRTAVRTTHVLLIVVFVLPDAREAVLSRWSEQDTLRTSIPRTSPRSSKSEPHKRGR